MKSVLISIQPKWCEIIASGKKTIEVRKTAPKLQTPFKCYIYCTKGMYANEESDTRARVESFYCPITRQSIHAESFYGKSLFHKDKDWYLMNGKVIGEFLCDRIDKYSAEIISCAKFEVNGAEVCEEFRYNAGACLDAEAMFSYSKGKSLYGWHISDLKIYDEPKELGKFSRFGFKRMGYSDCICANEECKYREEQNNYYDPPICMYGNGKQMNCQITRPPQSWCYVEEM